jgi:hypothetical protein
MAMCGEHQQRMVIRKAHVAGGQAMKSLIVNHYNLAHRMDDVLIEGAEG